MVLVGPSGSGKTTALRMLAGLEAVSDGRRSAIGERVVDDVAPRERDIAMVFQDYALYPQMTRAREPRVRAAPPREADARRDRAGACGGRPTCSSSSRCSDRRPRELSGGQQQRVALGRALVRDPQVFLMDEPLSNLDAKLRAQTRGEIRRLQQEVGTTTVYVTHDQVEAMTMGDRIAVMRDGGWSRSARPRRSTSGPRTVRRRLHRQPGDELRPRRRAAANQLPRAARRRAGRRAARARPAVGRRRRAARAARGRVEYVEALGRETFLGVRRDGGPRLVVCVDGRSGAQPGDRVTFGLVPGGLRFFDPQTGDAIERSR